MSKRILDQEYNELPKLLKETSKKQEINHPRKEKQMSTLPSKLKSPRIIRNRVKLEF